MPARRLNNGGDRNLSREATCSAALAVRSTTLPLVGLSVFRSRAVGNQSGCSDAIRCCEGHPTLATRAADSVAPTRRPRRRGAAPRRFQSAHVQTASSQAERSADRPLRTPRHQPHRLLAVCSLIHPISFPPYKGRGMTGPYTVLRRHPATFSSRTVLHPSTQRDSQLSRLPAWRTSSPVRLMP